MHIASKVTLILGAIFLVIGGIGLVGGIGSVTDAGAESETYLTTATDGTFTPNVNESWIISVYVIHPADCETLELTIIDTEGNDVAVDGGGITLKSSDSDKEIKWVNADDAWTFNQHLYPSADNSKNLGSSTKRWANIYTNDLHLANDRGDWTIIEEEEYLSIRNNKNGKMYKFVLEEIE